PPHYSSAFSPLFITAPSTPPTTLLSLHDALPISPAVSTPAPASPAETGDNPPKSPKPQSEQQALEPEKRQIASRQTPPVADKKRSEEHTSELQSPDHLVCRLLLEKKNKITTHLLD